MLRPCIVAGPDAQMLLRQLPQRRLPLPAAAARPGHAVPARPPRRRRRGARRRRRSATAPPGAYNLAGDGTITLGDLAARLGWLAVPGPAARWSARPRSAPSLPLVPTLAQWINAGRVAGGHGHDKARRELGWSPRYNTRETLRALVARSQKAVPQPLWRDQHSATAAITTIAVTSARSAAEQPAAKTVSSVDPDVVMAVCATG